MQERWNANMKVVIVGGVAGGATAAARIRRLNEQAEIVVFERSGYISYANCGLPYYIGDVITARSDLTLQTPESFYSRFRVNMKVRHEVTAIHPDRKTVSVKNLQTGEKFEESYDKLILSPGAKPTQPRLPGVGLDSQDDANHTRLQSLQNSLRIPAFQNAPQQVHDQQNHKEGWQYHRQCSEDCTQKSGLTAAHIGSQIHHNGTRCALADGNHIAQFCIA